MKTLAWLFGIFVCASSAYGQKTVTIEGDIRNIQVYLIWNHAGYDNFVSRNIS